MGRRGWSDAAGAALAVLMGVLGSSPATAQHPNQFGGQDRADAAAQMIVLAVQQAVSSLPPTSGQSFSYAYDPATLTFVASDQLGPTALLSTYTVGRGTFTFRAAASFFDMSESFGPITYRLDSSAGSGFAKFGLDASATVGLFNLSANYGLLNRVELSFNLPISVVDAQASQTFSVRSSDLGVPARDVRLAGAASPEALNFLLRDGQLAIREDSFTALGFDFNSGTDAGVGRIAVGAKGVVYAEDRLRLALAGQFFCPSPSEAEFAGPDSAAIYPRAVGQVRALDQLFFILDLGYDYDFEQSELSRFAWNVGAWVPGKHVSFDLGVGGSQYDTPIDWTPAIAQGRNDAGDFTLTAQGDNQLGTTFVDFLGGVKVRLLDQLVASGAVTVPLTDDGFRPDALGTVALEFYF